ncbi:hypothetical protein B0J14DRAFT_651524 [Halenospora varia]|nr:hypothetical protein B0J14DRAFT_651524 [Halenospora varia]
MADDSKSNVLDDWVSPLTQSPRIRQSLVCTSLGAWSLGTFMLCEEFTSEDSPYDALATWEDSGKKYCLRRRRTPITTRTPPDGDYDTGSFHKFGETVCHWELSPNVFVKAKAWAPGLTLEMETITWVRQTFPEIPVTKGIYGWADPAWERSFLISYRAKGELLETAWPRLSHRQKINIVEDVTKVIKKMATVTSETLRGIGGGLHHFEFLGAPKRDPSQKPRAPRAHPQYTAAELDKEMDKYWNTIKRNPRCKKFVFFHGDLSPGNVFLEAKGDDGKARLTEIIDFESSGFYPSWYILLNLNRYGYCLPTNENWKFEYSYELIYSVQKFIKDLPYESEWRKARAAVGYNHAKNRAREEADKKEYEELQKASKAKEASVDEAVNKLDDSKAWWE